MSKAIGVCICGIPRAPLIEFEVLLETLHGLQQRGIVGRVVYATWEEEKTALEPLIGALRRLDAVIVGGAPPKAVRTSRTFQQASLRLGLSYFGRDEYVLRARTDYFLDRLSWFLGNVEPASVAEKITGIRTLVYPFGFEDRIFAGPTRAMRRTVGRDWIFEEAGTPIAPQVTFFSQRYFDDFPLMEYACRFGYEHIHNALHNAVKTGAVIPDAVAKLYGAYLTVLARDFNILPPVARQPADLSAFLFDTACSNTEESLDVILREERLGSPVLASIVQWFERFKAEGMAAVERLMQDDIVQLSHFTQALLPNAEPGYLPVSLDTAGAVAASKSNLVVTSLAEATMSGAPIDLAAFTRPLAQAATTAVAQAHPPRLPDDVFELVMASARNWEPEAFQLVESIERTFDLSPDHVARINELANYLCRPQRPVFPDVGRYLATNIMGKDPYLSEHDEHRLHRLANWLDDIPAAKAPVWLADFRSKLREWMEPRCLICDGKRFGLMPSGRLARNGAAPRCLSCGSIEHQRVFRSMLQHIALTRGEANGLLFDHQKACLFGLRRLDAGFAAEEVAKPWRAGDKIPNIVLIVNEKVGDVQAILGPAAAGGALYFWEGLKERSVISVVQAAPVAAVPVLDRGTGVVFSLQRVVPQA